MFEEACTAIITESEDLDAWSFPSNRHSRPLFPALSWAPNFAGFHQVTSPSPLMQSVVGDPFHVSGATTLMVNIALCLIILKEFVVDRVHKMF